MAYQALYRKWRPTVFDDVVGQKHITQTLKNEIMTGRTAHAYLFTGIRGTGKTSTAKIFSRAINCINSKDGNPCNECEICRGILDGSILDVIEMDAASNNGVDNIRDLRDDVIYTASAAKYKVYIIDEVHMLSVGAFNALLKTLEEPPEHVKFILATTDVQKLPQTILSRCQRFDFRAISTEDIKERIKDIITADGYSVADDALELISEMADGSMRDGLSLTDRCLSFKTDGLTYDDAINILGVTDDKLNAEMLKAIAAENSGEALEALNTAISGGKAPSRIVEGLMETARNVLMAQLMETPENLAQTRKVKELCGLLTKEQLLNCVKIFSETLDNIKFAANKRIIVEMAFVKLCMPMFELTPESMAQRISVLEKKVEEGITINVAAKPAEPDKKPGVKKNPQMVKIEFNGKYNEKKKEILDAVKSENPGMAAFLKALDIAGENEIILLIAKDEKGENSVNFLKSAPNFREIFSECVEKVCGAKPAKVEFECNVTVSQNMSLIEKLKSYSFVKIHE